MFSIRETFTQNMKACKVKKTDARRGKFRLDSKSTLHADKCDRKKIGGFLVKKYCLVIFNAKRKKYNMDMNYVSLQGGGGNRHNCTFLVKLFRFHLQKEPSINFSYAVSQYLDAYKSGSCDFFSKYWKTLRNQACQHEGLSASSILIFFGKKQAF